MEIIYRQPSGNSLFDETGVSDCWVKYLHTNKDIKNTNPKLHNHTGFEIHIMKNGHQKYCAEGNEFDLKSGYTLIIPHKIKHQSLLCSNGFEKISLTFKTNANSPFCSLLKPLFFETGNEITKCTDCLMNEYRSKSIFHSRLIENYSLETLIQILRQSGCVKITPVVSNTPSDFRIAMAKQYIADNIDLSPNVDDVASYCYLSSKQLTRLFHEYENTTPAAYIRKLKTSRIETLLASEMSLKSISEKMNFSDEFHFNSFFKANAGMSPGKFRKMINANSFISKTE